MAEVTGLLPPELTGKEGIVVYSLADCPLTGVYFSAHWCPPCRGFTPILSEFYKTVNKEKKQIEIIFVSSDQDESQFKEYYETMPWIALPFENQDSKEILSDAFNVQGIPTLLIFNKEGKLIDPEGRMTVQQGFKNDAGKAQGIIDDWMKK